MVLEFMYNNRIWTADDVNKFNFWGMPKEEQADLENAVKRYLNVCLLYVLQFKDYTDSFDTGTIFDEKLFWSLADMIDWLTLDAYDTEVTDYDLEKSYEKRRYIFELIDGRFIAFEGTSSPYNGFESNGVWNAYQVFPHNEVKTVTVWKEE